MAGSKKEKPQPVRLRTGLGKSGGTASKQSPEKSQPQPVEQKHAQDLVVELEVYRAQDGSEPFTDWLEALDDPIGVAQIEAALDKVSAGNLRLLKPIKGYDDLKEIKIVAKGPGYRIYCIQSGLKLIILLGAGIKSTQAKDIKKAWDRRNDFRSS